MKKRLDILLVERGLCETREKAKREIMAGNVTVNGETVTKPGTGFKDTGDLVMDIKDRLKYVSRGGLKLEKAIIKWKLDFRDKVILDIGASTGGFTDCSLQEGAARVYSVDVGKNQLDWKLRTDGRVVSIEGKHIKDLTLPEIENNKADFIVIDVSFISLTKVISHLRKFIGEGGKIIALIKPQFEVGREKIGKNGIVVNEEYHDEAIKKIISFSEAEGYILEGIEESPIKGARGNREFLMLLSNGRFANDCSSVLENG